MEKQFKEMMEWSLGKDYENLNVKKAPQTWREIHPDFVPLFIFEDKPIGLNVCYFIFQMTACWMAKEMRYCELALKNKTPKKESQNEKGFIDRLRSICVKFMQLFHKHGS